MTTTRLPWCAVLLSVSCTRVGGPAMGFASDGWRPECRGDWAPATGPGDYTSWSFTLEDPGTLARHLGQPELLAVGSDWERWTPDEPDDPACDGQTWQLFAPMEPNQVPILDVEAHIHVHENPRGAREARIRVDATTNPAAGSDFEQAQIDALIAAGLSTVTPVVVHLDAFEERWSISATPPLDLETGVLSTTLR